MFVSDKENENKMIKKSYAHIHQDTTETHAYMVLYTNMCLHMCAHEYTFT